MSTDPQRSVASLRDALLALPYLGRGLAVVGLPGGGLAASYFLTGRSRASRERRLTAVDQNTLLVRDISGVDDDPLRHYTAFTRVDDRVILGNGRQVDATTKDLESGTSVWETLAAHGYEPDPPIHTPRITLVAEDGGAMLYLSMSRHSALGRSEADVQIGRFSGLQPGEGLLLTTYDGDITRPRAASGWREVTSGADDPARLLTEITRALPADLAVGAFSVEIGRKSHEPLVWHAATGE